MEDLLVLLNCVLMFGAQGEVILVLRVGPPGVVFLVVLLLAGVVLGLQLEPVFVVVGFEQS